MSGQFAGKTVAITGAAGGIGHWLCRFFGQEGATIAALDRNDHVNELVDTLGADGITVKAAVADIAKADEVKAAFAGFGDVHLLINNAGVSRHPTLAVTDPHGWESDIASNLNGAYACAHAVLPQMITRRAGSIVNVSSVNGLLALGDPAYSAAKAGMIALTKALAMEYGRYGIRANCVLPGTVRTPIWDERKAKDPNVLKQLERWYPLGRIVEPDEVARVIAFLASDAASAVTGVALPVDCGLTAGNIVMARELTLEDFEGEELMDRLRIGVIGLGWFGEIHAETIAGVPNLQLAALCTRTPDRLAAMGEKFGVTKLYRDYHDLLADPEIDAVSICTMWDQHREPAIAALKAGKHVFLEKPIASTVEDARAITAASKGAKGILFIGHVVRFNPRYRMAKQAIDEGRIGKIVALSSRRNIPAAWTPTILDKIGPIVGDAIHDTDIMLWFTGDRVVSAYAQTVDVRGLKHPDIGQTMYRFAGGATATLETVWCMPEKTPFDIDERMSIIGTEGIIHVQDTFPNLGIVDGNRLHSPDTTYWPMFDGVRGGALREEFNYFARTSLTGGKVTIGTPEDATAALEATLAAEESARSGDVVRIG